MLHHKKMWLRKDKNDGGDSPTSSSSASSPTTHNFQEPHSSSDERPSPPPRMPERPELPPLEEVRPAPDTSSSLLLLNHSNNGPFLTTHRPPARRPTPYGAPTHIYPIPPQYLFNPHQHLIHQNMIFPLHRPLVSFNPFPQPPTFLQALPQLPPRPHVPEVDRGLLHRLPDIDVELIREERHSPRPSSSAMSNQFTPTLSHSSYSGSSPRSVGMSPTGSRAGDGTPPTSTTRKRRRQDTLVPPGCPLTRREIVELPIDEFNELIEKKNFSEEQKAKFRDLRRKGKNRVMLLKVIIYNWFNKKKLI